MHWLEWQAWYQSALEDTDADELDDGEPEDAWRRNLNDGKPIELPDYVRDQIPTLDE